MPTKAILFFFSCLEVKSTWLITSELANQRARKALFTCVVYTKIFYYCVVPENIHTSPTEGIFSKTSHPSGNFNKALHFSLNFWVSQKPHPPGNSNPFCGESRDIFWMCTLTTDIIQDFQLYGYTI